MFSSHNNPTESSDANNDDTSTNAADVPFIADGQGNTTSHGSDLAAKYVGIWDNDQSRYLKEEEYSACVALLDMAASPKHQFNQTATFDSVSKLSILHFLTTHLFLPFY